MSASDLRVVDLHCVDYADVPSSSYGSHTVYTIACEIVFRDGQPRSFSVQRRFSEWRHSSWKS